MNIKERLSHLWNVTLGPDYKDDDEIENIDTPEMQDLKESLERIEKMEQKLSSPKSGKGGKSSKVVETVAIDPKAVKVLANKAQEKADKDVGREIE